MQILKRLLGGDGDSKAWSAEVARLEGDVAASEQEHQRLTTERAGVALPALSGDTAAQKSLARIDAELTALRQRVQTISDGLAEARVRRDEALATEAADAEKNRRTRFDRAVAELLLADERLDTAMEALAEAISKRDAILEAMKREGLLRVDAARTLANRRTRGLMSAAAASGLAAVLPVTERVNPVSAHTISEFDRQMLVPRTASSEEPTAVEVA